jgi:hypothetical protein
MYWEQFVAFAECLITDNYGSTDTMALYLDKKFVKITDFHNCNSM